MSESYKAALDERAAAMRAANESEGSSMTANQLDPDLSIFTEATGGAKKGRLLSFGRGFAPPKKRTSSTPNEASLDIEQDPKFIELKEKLDREMALREEQDRKMEELQRKQAESNAMMATIISQMSEIQNTQRAATVTDFRPADFAPW